MKRLLLLPILIVGFALAARAQIATDVYWSGMNAYDCFRIPSIVRAADGTLLAFAEARRNSTADRGDIDLVVRLSSDEGRTWGPMQIVWNDGDNTCGNPAAVVEHKSGRIFLFACWNHADDHERDIETGRSHSTRQVWLLTSDDNGATWNSPRNMTAELKQPGWTWYATGPCHAIQITRGRYKGRMVVSANHKLYEPDAEGNRSVTSHSHVIYSDDAGRTWHFGGTAPEGGNESTVVELPANRLMLNMRSYSRADSCRSYSISRNGGLTWGPRTQEPALVEPRCQGSMLNYMPRGKATRTLLFSNPHSTRRRNMSIGVSRDAGKSWSRFHTVFVDESAYSDMVQLSDGSVGILFERGNAERLYDKISFRTIGRDELLGK